MTKVETHRFYCDEAGNTGANYIDQNQPVMVYGGWLIRIADETQIVASIESLEAASQATEIHASQLLKRPRGWVRAAKLIAGMLRAGAVPFFYIVEKRYQLAERVIHALLDSHTNNRAVGVPQIGTHGYLELIELLCGLPASSMLAFAKAIAHPSTSSVQLGIQAVADGIRSLGHEGIVYRVEGCLDNLRDVIDYDFSDRGGHSHAQVTSPHLPGCLRMLEAVDAFAERGGCGLIRVVHDETRQYGSVLKEWVGTMRKIGEHGKVKMPIAGFPAIGFAHVADFETMASRSSRCVQSADVLATSLAQLAIRVVSGRPWELAGLEIAWRILGPLLSDNLAHGGISASKGLVATMRARMLSATP